MQRRTLAYYRKWTVRLRTGTAQDAETTSAIALRCWPTTRWRKWTHCVDYQTASAQDTQTQAAIGRAAGCTERPAGRYCLRRLTVQAPQLERDLRLGFALDDFCRTKWKNLTWSDDTEMVQARLDAVEAWQPNAARRTRTMTRFSEGAEICHFLPFSCNRWSGRKNSFWRLLQAVEYAANFVRPGNDLVLQTFQELKCCSIDPLICGLAICPVVFWNPSVGRLVGRRSLPWLLLRSLVVAAVGGRRRCPVRRCPTRGAPVLTWSF